MFVAAFLRCKKGKIMEKTTEHIKVEQDIPQISRKIGNTTFTVGLYFNENAQETMQDKVERMIKNEVQSNNF